MEIICGDICIQLGIVKGEKVIKLVSPVKENLTVTSLANDCALLESPDLAVFVDLDKITVTSKTTFEAIASSPTTPDTFTRLRDFLNTG